MKQAFWAVGLMMVAGQALAAPKPCEELKAEIEAKLKDKGRRM